MWFKRRKKNEQEQDQALSQSLRSLQSLLNDSDRREPSLDTRSAKSGAGPSDKPGEPSVKPRQPDTPSRHAESREPGPVLKEPPPADSASRWRDLSLSFDAESMVPARNRRDPDDDGSEHLEAEPGDEPPEDAEQAADDRVEGHESPERAFDDTLNGGELDTLEEPAGDEDDDEALNDDAPGHDQDLEPAPPGYDSADDSGEDTEARGNNDAGDGPDDIVERDNGAAATDNGDTELEPPPIKDDTVVDFEAFSRPPGGPSAGDEAPVDEEAYIQVAETSINDPAPVATDDSTDPDREAQVAESETTSARERAEDQLYLELEPVGNTSEDAIPTLTEAVYVPDDASPLEPAAEPPAGDETTAEGPEAEQPGDSAATTDEPAADVPVIRVIEQLRTRLQLMELDELSPEQEDQLRETLQELMDDLRNDEAGH